MEFRMGRSGPIVLLIVAGYVGTMMAQSRAAESVCLRHPVGTSVDSIEDIEASFLLTPKKGVTADPEEPQRVIFCASLTMCDNACEIVIDGGEVVTSRHSRL